MEIKIRDKVEIGHLPTLETCSPPSSTSSPAHEFSFTISLHHHQPPSTTRLNRKSTTPPPPFAAVDLSPADDIFFHGHLLPLHLLSHLPVSPRSSTNSLDSFTLPITELLLDNDQDHIINEHDDDNIMNDDDYIENTSFQELGSHETKPRYKSKSFSIFGLPKWRKGCDKDGEWQKKKFKFDVSDVVKKYMKMVRPLLSFRSSAASRSKQFHHQPYSFSGGSVSSRGKQDQLRGRRRLFSAPASTRTSPTNSGLLLATGALATANSTSSDSTMEELQAAIQAAITHCKNSIAVEEKFTSQD